MKIKEKEKSIKENIRELEMEVEMNNNVDKILKFYIELSKEILKKK